MTESNLLTPAAKADIQGFLTSGFGHLPHSAYLFVALHERGGARQWLQQLLQHVTTSESWRRQPGAPKQKPLRTLNVAFTYPGLAALGLSPAALRTFPEEFRLGMAHTSRAHILGDTGASAPANWELGGPQNEPLHALLILNAETEAELATSCDEQRRLLEETAGAVSEQVRSTQHGARSVSGTEHFGFFDGVAQPQIEGIKGEGIRTGEFIFGYQNEYGFFPAGPIVPATDDYQRILPVSANPFHRSAGYRDLGMHGSFVVYRKLAQDVAAFWRFLGEESVRRHGAADPQFMVWLAAKMVGRWPSGVPLILAPETDRSDLPDQAQLRSDDFLYARSDPYGLVCPFGSHIRRTNPRDQIGRTLPQESLHMSSRHRLLRRGKPYGPALFDPGLLLQPEQREAVAALLNLQDDGQVRGVHFLCVNASIKSQFEFVQQVWVNNPAFSGLLNNRDPIAGNNDPLETPGAAPSSMVVPGRPAALRTAPLPRFVTMRGGAYLFMPSVTALRYLAELY